MADIGSKPSTIIELFGTDIENCRITLISADKQIGMTTVTEYAFSQQKEAAVSLLWNAIQDEGYEKAGWKYVYPLRELKNQQIEWAYHPPEEFRVAIYWPSYHKVVICSEVLKRYTFRSYFQIRIKDAQILQITSHYKYGRELLSFLLRLLATLAIEVLLALAFGFRKKEYLWIIAKINVWTQIGLNLGVLLAEFKMGTGMAFVLCFILEIPVFLIEAHYYVKEFRKMGVSKNKTDWAVVYAFVANIISFGAGMFLQNNVFGLY